MAQLELNDQQKKMIADFDKLEEEAMEKIKALALNNMMSQRWLNLGKDSLQNAFMQLRRAVARPKDK